MLETGLRASLGSSIGFRRHHGPGDRRVEGFRNHIAIDGSLKRVSGRDAACGWTEVQLKYDKEEPWYATYGTLLAESVLRLHRGAHRISWPTHRPYGQYEHLGWVLVRRRKLKRANTKGCRFVGGGTLKRGKRMQGQVGTKSRNISQNQSWRLEEAQAWNLKKKNGKFDKTPKTMELSWEGVRTTSMLFT